MATTTASVVVCVTAAVLVLGLLGVARAHDVAAGDVADSSARTPLAPVRRQAMTILMNFVKCLQRASNDIYRIINEILVEVASCMTKQNPFEVARCMVNDSALKRFSAFVVKIMDVVKCSLE